MRVGGGRPVRLYAKVSPSSCLLMRHAEQMGAPAKPGVPAMGPTGFPREATRWSWLCEQYTAAPLGLGGQPGAVVVGPDPEQVLVLVQRSQRRPREMLRALVARFE